MSIRHAIPSLSSLALPAACMVLPLLAGFATVQSAEKDLVINGPYYKKLVQQKDIVADILPPPAYIIESYLTVLQLVDRMEVAMADNALDDSEKKAIDELLDYITKLKQGNPGVFPGYTERIDVWKKELSEATPEDKAVKDALLKASLDPALKFYDLCTGKLASLAKAGNVAGCKKLVRDELKPLYAAHRTGIDDVVTKSRTINEKIEREVALKLAKATKSPGSVTMADIRIKSPLYIKIIAMKDLVADILPPPCYIIESYLNVLQVIDETEIALEDGSINPAEKKKIDDLVEYGRQLKEGESEKGEMAGYTERQTFWNGDLTSDTPDDEKIKTLMTKTSYDPAMRFYTIRDSAFIEAIKKGAVVDAKKVAREQLVPTYNEHRKAIDQLVEASNKMYEKIQGEVDKLLK